MQLLSIIIEESLSSIRKHNFDDNKSSIFMSIIHLHGFREKKKRVIVLCTIYIYVI